MHRYRTVAQISLILSVLNLVLAAPIVVQEIHEARYKGAKDVAAMPTASERPTSPGSSPDAMGSPQHSSLSDGSMSSGYPAPYLSEDESVSGYSWLLDRPPRLNLDSPASMQESPDHPGSLHGSTSSGYPTPYLSSDSSVSGYSWLLDRPPRLNLDLPASLQGSATPHWHPPSLGSSGILLPWWLQELAPEMVASPDLQASLHGSASPHPPSSGSSVISLPWWVQELAPERPPSPASLHGSASPHPSSSGSPVVPLGEWLAPEEIPPSPPAEWQGLEPHLPHSSSSHASERPFWPAEMVASPQLTESDHATTESYNPQDSFTPLHHPSSLSSPDSSGISLHSDESMSTPYSSALDGSLSSHYLTASEGSAPSHHSMPEVLAPSTHLTLDGSPPETPPDNAEFFNKNMIKKLKIVAGMLIVGGAIAVIVGSQIKHHNKHRDYQDS